MTTASKTKPAEVDNRFLMNTWYCAGWSSQVTRTPLQRWLVGQPILFFRSTEGECVALSNACPHRFAPLGQGELEGDVITCPYHGLAFDKTGACVRNPHSDGVIPSGARVRKYPVVERQGAIWIWMGDREPDESKVVDLQIIENGSRMITGHLEMPVDYRLLVDNLLDLLHAPYLHKSIYTGSKTRETEFLRDGDHVIAKYTDRNVPAPATQKPFFEGERGDYHSYIDWNPPGVMHNGTMMTHVGADPMEGAVLKGGHIITPATATDSHYFWYSTRNRRVDDTQMDEKMEALLNRIFTTEDEPMIVECQTNMGGHGDLLALRSISLPTDVAGLHARRVMARLIAAEYAEDAE